MTKAKLSEEDAKLFHTAEEMELFGEAIADAKVAEMLGPNPEPEDDPSSIVTVLSGMQGTAKSGIAMAEARAASIASDGGLVFVVDLDNANIPLWKAHHNRDPNIRVRNPAMWVESENDDGTPRLEIDYDATLKNIQMMMFGIRKLEIAGHNVSGVIFDGLDTLQDDAEMTMRAQNELEVDEGVKFQFWRIRNKLFRDCIASCKSLDCAKYFITHNKEYKTYKKVKQDGKWIEVVDKQWVEGHWDKKTPDEMWQIVYCRRIDFKSGRRIYTAYVDKFKGHPEYENQEYLIMDIDAGIPTWYGLPILRDDHYAEDPVEFDIADFEDEEIKEDTGYDSINGQ